MKFLIVTNTPHKVSNNKIYAYGPYIKEMNVWIKNVEEVKVISFRSHEDINKIEVCYEHDNIEFVEIPTFNLTSIKNIFKTSLFMPFILYTLFKHMLWANHIHLRSPSNMALLGLFVQMFFPNKNKTVKYAANWDMSSNQPLSYRIQQRLMGNTFLSKNLKALIYGEWPNQTDNIVSFFTATYYDYEREKVDIRKFEGELNIIFSGRLVSGKRPLLTIQVVEKLIKKGHKIHLDIVGDGEERKSLEQYIVDNNLSDDVSIHGRQNSDTLKSLYKKAHFLVFLSKSEGWGKVITEAMFWGCLPITTDVGPISYILGNGKRGALVEPDVDAVCIKIEEYMDDYNTYKRQAEDAVNWSQKLTLDSFNTEIKRLLND